MESACALHMLMEDGVGEGGVSCPGNGEHAVGPLLARGPRKVPRCLAAAAWSCNSDHEGRQRRNQSLMISTSEG